jgi:hypothetical protein
MKQLIACMITFMLCLSANAIQIPDTGQTDCFDTQTTISCPSETDPFYGQDAQFSFSPQILVKLDISGNPLPDGASEWSMVMDQTTGLIWEVKTDDGSIHDKDNQYGYYYLEEKFIDRMNQNMFGGFSDWRIPEMDELNTLTNIRHHRPSINPQYFPNTRASDYWTATPHVNDTSQGWCVSFFHGNDSIQSRQSAFYVRAVRGSVYIDPNKFHDNNDGTITDTLTGLMWQKETITGQSWKDALNTCQKLELAGYNDWRLPGKEVLRSIVDYTQYAASLNKQYFPQSASTAYWTSTSDQQQPTQAWCIHFQYGNDLSRSKNQLYAVRAVRGGHQTRIGNIEIFHPSTGDRLNAGTETFIQWSPSNIAGLIDIQLSQFGGIEGSFETIIADSANDGQEQWIVSGETSENCVIRIVPNLSPDTGASLGMFSIDHFSGAWIDATPLRDYHTYRLMLTGQYDNHVEWLTTQWQFDAMPGVSLFENRISTTQNNWVRTFCLFESITYEKWIALYHSIDLSDNEPNNTVDQSVLMENRRFYTGLLPENDSDIYKIAVFANEIIELSFLPQTRFADYRVQIKDDMNVLIYDRYSTDGRSFHTQLGFTEGNYYVHVMPNGDTSPTDLYTISYASTGSFETNTIQPIHFGDTITGRNASLVDISSYSFSLTQTTGIIFDFYPSNYPIDYDIQFKNSSNEIVTRAESMDQQKIHLEILLARDTYTIAIIPENQVDRSVQYRLFIDRSPIPIENDANQTLDTAMTFDIQQPVRGSLKDADDIDFFHFSNELPEIKLLTLADAPDGSDTWIRIYKDSENHPTHQFYVQDGIFFSKNIGITTGRYYISLTPQTETSKRQYYTLAFKTGTTSTVEIEPNDNLSWCNAMPDDKIMPGMVYPETDIDYYGFNLQSSGSVNFLFEALNVQTTYDVTLLDTNKNIIQHRTVSQANVYTDLWMLSSGNYYFQIKSDDTGTGEYRLHIHSNVPIKSITRIQSISIMNVPQSLSKNEIYPLSVQAHLSNAENIPVTNPNWHVINENILTIDANGFVSALDSGETTIIASWQRKVADCQIGVDQLPSNLHDYGQLILVAGAHESESSGRLQTTQYLADMVYKRFLERRFHHDDIYYFNSVLWHDLDGDGYDDNIVDISTPDISSFINVFNHIKANIDQSGPLYIYLIGPGGNNAFEIAPEKYISALLLNDLMYDYSLSHDRPIICMVESPKSGQFIDSFSVQDAHVLITASGATDAHTQFNGRISFTQLFLDRLSEGHNLESAFHDARTALYALRQPFVSMTPTMVSSESNNDIQLGGPFNLDRPEIQMTVDNPLRTIPANTLQKIGVSISSDNIISVDAIISSPDYLIPEPVADFEFPSTGRTNFSLASVPETNDWQATYERFEYSGNHWMDLCIMDSNGYLTISQAFSFTVINGKETDMDFDGMPDAWEDRYIGLDKSVPDASEDIDKDGLSNIDEYLWQCNPIIADTDQDQLQDGWEVSNGLNPIDSSDAWLDPDNDNVTNYQEFLDNTDPQDETSFVQHYGDIRGEIYTDLVGYEVGIKDAQITIIENEMQTTSTQEGLFAFTDLPYARYTIQILAENFKQYRANVFLCQHNVFIGKVRLLFEAEHPECDLNENDVLDLPDIIRALQVLTLDSN